LFNDEDVQKEVTVKFFQDNGFLVYERIGSGIPILFIHGFPLSRKIWIAQQKGLTDIAEFISFDLRGCGDSYPFEAPYSMELLAADCKRLLESENITSPLIVCGLSMGGYITLALYRKYPQLFKAMILTSTRAGADSDQGKVNRENTIKNVREHGVGYIVDDMLPKLLSNSTLSTRPSLVNTLRSIMLETSVQGVVGSSEAMKNRVDSTSILSQIKFPVLIVHGADDKLIPTSEAQNMHQQITNSHLEIIPSAGHLPNMEQPDLYNQIIRDFVISLG
jgi:3-oxoadipate enol-lactonase